MGMFNDNVSAHRTGWSYKYTGKELFSYAQKLYKEYRAKEEEARNKMADLMRDMTIPNTDPRVSDTKRDIVSFGTLKEQCLVFVHEFSRFPGQVYELGMGDVTFFGIATEK
jgi:hypothetical protein